MGSIFKSEQEQQLLVLCEQHLKPLGYRPVDIDFRLSHRSLLRVYIERLRGNGSKVSEVEKTDETQGVTIDDCSNISRHLSPVFDSLDFIPGAYDLEVSSPGLDRRLRLDSDFEASVGEKVKIKLVSSLDGRANISGILMKVESETVVVDSQNDEIVIPLEKIVQAIRVWQF